MTDLLMNLMMVIAPMAFLAWLFETMHNASIEKRLKKPPPDPRDKGKGARR
ncbi:MAG: hypothetical protein ACPGU7_07335 [Gammaproteobacteria bacterium]